MQISQKAGGMVAVALCTVMVVTLLAVGPGRVEAQDGDCTVTIANGDYEQETVDSAPPGATICFAPGTHRGVSVVPVEGQTFRGAEGAILSGAVVLDPAEAIRDGADYYWPRPQSPQPDPPTPEQTDIPLTLPGREQDLIPNELFVDDTRRLNHVASRGDLAEGTYWIDESAERVYVRDDPSTFDTIEYSVTPLAIAPLNTPTERRHADDVRIENLIIEKYASPVQFGAIGGGAFFGDGSERWTIERVEVRYNHGCGIRVVTGGTLTNSLIRHNGQLGLCGAGQGTPNPDPTLVADNWIAENMALGFNWAWEGGAMKFTRFDGFTFRNNLVRDNAGAGIWFDIENRHVDIVSNWVEGNEQVGIFYEVSFGDTNIYWNILRDNGVEGDGNQVAGIWVSESNGAFPEVEDGVGYIEVFENVIQGSVQGLRASDGAPRTDIRTPEEYCTEDPPPLPAGIPDYVCDPDNPENQGADYALINYWAHDNSVSLATDVAPDREQFMHVLNRDSTFLGSDADLRANTRIEDNLYYGIEETERLFGYTDDDDALGYAPFRNIPGQMHPTPWTQLGFDTCTALPIAVPDDGIVQLPRGAVAFSRGRYGALPEDQFAPQLDHDPAPQVSAADVSEETAADVAIEISRRRFPQSEVEFVVLSRDDIFADSLAASGLLHDAPLFFTQTGSLGAPTAEELRRVLPALGRIYILGGEMAVSSAVEQQLENANYEVVRLSGPTRFETAVAVAEEMRSLGAFSGEIAIARADVPAEVAQLAGGATAAWADSISAGAYAANRCTPILLTGSDQLHPAAREWMVDNDLFGTIVLGGTAAVSDDVVADLDGLRADDEPVRRIAGDNRFGTAQDIANDLWEQPQGFLVTSASDDLGWATGLAAAGLGADLDYASLLVETSRLPAETRTLLCATSTRPPVTTVASDGQIDAEVLEEIENCAAPE